MLKIDISKKLHGSRGDMTLFVNAVVNKGEFIALMGESGSGKTTLLRVLAGLEEATGAIELEGVAWLNGSQNIKSQHREIGFVFQDYALFDNMSVEENLLFVNDDKTLAKQLLEMTDLATLDQRNVQALSGGQKQRVSLCRAMMKKPKLLLMDEPLSALDPQMRAKLQKEIKQLHDTFGTTTIMVSHDVREVYTLAERVWVMKQGQIVQDDLVDEVLASKDKEYKVEVLKLMRVSGKTMARVFLATELMDVEVSEMVKIGDIIELKLNPQIQ